MKRLLKSRLIILSVIISLVLSSFMNISSQANSVSITGSGGWFESAYVQWSPVNNATGYNVYVKSASANDSSYVRLDNQLIRQYPSYWRADAIGLSAGNYVLKVEAILSSSSVVSATTSSISVKAHDRSGFAFSSASTYASASGAYNDNGTLKNEAQILYITSDTASTVSLDVVTSSSGAKTTGVGIGNILNLRQKGYDTTPLAIRFIGKVSASNMSNQLTSSGYLQVKGKNAYSLMNITIEGIGNDATAYGFGLLLRNCANVEVRNIGIMLFDDDGISLDTDNCNIWVHNNDIFYGSAGSDADQVKGDGSADIKGESTYVTFSYNHFFDSGKVSLCGMSDTAQFFATYHHNWFDHSDSRHPRIRVGSTHIYNNFYDGISKYGVGTTKGSSAFVESNYFRNAKYPMMSSLQGTDALGEGTFSGENGGMIKSYNNSIVSADSLIYANSNSGTSNGNSTSFDAYLASSRTEFLPSSYKTLVGGTTYNNFDTSMDIGVTIGKIDSVSNVESIVINNAGRLQGGDFTWNFNDATDDRDYGVNTALMTKINNYQSTLVAVGGNSSQGPIVTPTTPSPTPSPTPTPNLTPTPNPSTGGYVHNFTTSGKTSAFFQITGNLSTSKGTVSYNGLTLTQCLKIESSTSITFTTSGTSTLTLVLNSTDGTDILVNGTSYVINNGIVTVQLAAGSYTITKGDVSNLFYMSVQ